METIRLYESDAAADGVQPEMGVPRFPGDRNERLVSIYIAGTATVKIEGRLSSEHEWIEVVEPHTASELVSIAYTPRLRAVISGVSGQPTVKAHVTRQ